MRARTARAGDAIAVHRVIAHYAGEGSLLPRTEAEIRKHISLFLFIPLFHENDEMADVLADFGFGAREQRTLAGVVRDHAMHGDRIGGASGAGDRKSVV